MDCKGKKRKSGVEKGKKEEKGRGRGKRQHQ